MRGVDTASLGGTEVVVQRVAHDRVRELEAERDRAQQVRIDERVECGLDRAGLQAGELGKKAEVVELEAAKGGERPGHRTCVRAQIEKAVHDRARRAQRRGRGCVPPEARAPVGDDELARGDQRPHAFGHVERVALCRLPEGAHERVVGRGIGDHAGECAHVVGVERFEVEHHREAVAAQPVERGREHGGHVGWVRARRRDERHRIALEPADQQREDGQRVGVGRVQVVDCEHDGFGAGPADKELFERTERAGAAASCRPSRPCAAASASRSSAATVEQRGVAFGRERVAQRGVDRRERDVAVELVEPARQHPVAEHVGLFEHCSEEPRLSDPGLAADDDHRRGTSPGCLQRLYRALELGVASDQRARHRGDATADPPSPDPLRCRPAPPGAATAPSSR